MGSLLEKQWQLRPLPLTSAPGLVGLLPDTFAPGWSSPSAEPAEKRRCLDCKHCACAGTQRAPFSSHSDLHSTPSTRAGSVRSQPGAHRKRCWHSAAGGKCWLVRFRASPYSPLQA